MVSWAGNDWRLENPCLYRSSDGVAFAPVDGHYPIITHEALGRFNLAPSRRADAFLECIFNLGLIHLISLFEAHRRLWPDRPHCRSADGEDQFVECPSPNKRVGHK